MKKNIKTQENKSRFTKVILVFLALFAFLIILNYLDITGNVFRESTDGYIQVSSKPDDASIYIDNVYYGVTSKEIRLGEGYYMLRIERNGYIPYEKEIAIEAGKRPRLKVVLVREG